MKRLIVLLAVALLAVAPVANGQAWLNSMGKRVADRAEQKAKQKVEERINRKVDEATDRALDSAEAAAQKGLDEANRGLDEADKALQESGVEASDGTVEEQPVSAADRKRAEKAKAAGGEAAQAEPTAQKAAPERAAAAYNKFDFVAGDKIIFEDNHSRETLGEFPSQWDLIEGEAENAKVDGVNVISIKNNTTLRPFMQDMFNYLGDVFTVEFDYYNFLEKEDENYGELNIHFVPADQTHATWYNPFEIEFANNYRDKEYNDWGGEYKNMTYTYKWKTTTDEDRNGSNKTLDLGYNSWHHVSISFNKRAMKVYVDATRIANIPNMKANCGWLAIVYDSAADNYPAYVRNFRIAQGAVPLYDRMMSEGKFITYGITFDVGKSEIKPESTGELNRIVQMMTDDQTLKFSVEGHTDNTGNAASNQTLSEARSKAIANRLVEMGIGADRLSSAGKGQNNPIADNATDEGRAKNRRVEFVKQ